MPIGAVKTYIPDKGFGFITPDDGSPDIFAHKRSFTGGKEEEIKEGAKVYFETEVERHTNKLKASKWTIISDYPSAFQASLPPAYGAMAAYGIADFSAVLGLGAQHAAAAAGGAQTPQEAPAIPQGWEQASDPKTGRTYFANRITGEASWTTVGFPRWVTEPPPVVIPQESLPLGWEQTVDALTGRIYFVNRSTGESRWTLVARDPQEQIPDKDWLVSEVKRLQKLNRSVPQMWRDFCQEGGNGTLDPSRHQPLFLHDFCKAVKAKFEQQTTEKGTKAEPEQQQQAIADAGPVQWKPMEH